MRIRESVFWAVVPLLLLPACTQHRVEVAPVEIKPIHITVDVNVKIEKEIDNYFGDLFKKEEELRKKKAENKTE